MVGWAAERRGSVYSSKMAHPSSTRVLYLSLAGNVLVALAKAGAAMWTGSAAMASEAIHAFVDTANELLLVHGVHRSRRRPDIQHPLGYGRELYFWSFIVALLVFSLGALVALFQGVDHIVHPAPIRRQLINNVVLAFAFIVDGASWYLAFRQFVGAKGESGFYEAFLRSKDPPSFIVLFENSAAVLGTIVAVIGTLAAVAFRAPICDGVASIVIALILGVTAVLIARESKSLLIGERADPWLSQSVLQIVTAQIGVVSAHALVTTQLSPNQVVVALSIEFADEMRTGEIEDLVLAMEDEVRAAHPEVVALFVKPQTAGTFKIWRQARFDDIG